jgi:hypothetical protein
MPRGRALREETITHALHFTGNEKLPCNWRHIRQIEFNMAASAAQSNEGWPNQKFSAAHRNFFLRVP